MSINNRRMSAKFIDATLALILANVIAFVITFFVAVAITIFFILNKTIIINDYSNMTPSQITEQIVDFIPPFVNVILYISQIVGRLIGVIFYFFLFALIYKNSPGKRMMGLVIKHPDMQVTSLQLLKREPFIQVYILFAIISSTAYLVEMIYYLFIIVIFYYLYLMFSNNDYWNKQQNFTIDHSS